MILYNLVWLHQNFHSNAMKTTIYVGQVSHIRFKPSLHQFCYPIYYYAFDLSELPTLDQHSILFSYNQPNLISLYDRDYLNPKTGSLFNKVQSFLDEHVPQATAISRIKLVTAARYLTYAFNPVSFFFCYDRQDKLRCVLVEVNNTFSETHLYVLQNPLTGGAPSFSRYRIDKDFHVSPFFDRQGSYEFTFKQLGQTLDIRISLIKHNKLVFTAQLKGQARPFSTGALLKTVWQYPVGVFKTMPLIHWEAALLFFKRRLSVYSKPIPTSVMTIGKNPATRLQRLAMEQLFRLLKNLPYGCLELVLPDQSRHYFGDTQHPDRHRVTIYDYQLFWRLAVSGEIGLGEGYTAGEWDSDDLVGFVSLLIRNVSLISQPETKVVQRMVGLYHRGMQKARANTIFGSRKNINAHYDLGNDFYELFLDESLTYSCAFFTSPEESLHAAQLNKLHQLINKVPLKAHHHLLEIGTGWGSLAIEAVKLTGCRVTTITLSTEQAELARQRVKAAGLTDQIQVLLCDYRTLRGQYDHIISIEMLEAVGHDYLADYFQVIDRLLKPDGVMALQTITIPDQRYEQYRYSFDWIRKHIFPGGHLPSLQILTEILTNHTSFVVEDLENIGPHYALTLQRWRENFEQAKSKVLALGYDETFCRKWRYYLAYCEAAFATRHINTLQMVLTRANNKNLEIF